MDGKLVGAGNLGLALLKLTAATFASDSGGQAYTTEPRV